MIRCALALLAGFLAAPMALACETGLPQAMAAGELLVRIQTENAELEALFNADKATYEALQAEASEKQGDAAWQDDIDHYRYQLQTYSEEWEIGQKMLGRADVDFAAALTAHETACGAGARTGEILSALGLQKTP